MKADYLSYQRATRVSLLGLVIQLALGLLLLIFSLYTSDRGAQTASVFILLGVPVWLSLAILFDQHRRERIEAIEAEAFAASDAASSSVFEERSEDLRVAAKRLKALYKFMLPGMSLLVAGLLIGMGLLRFFQARRVFGEWQPYPEAKRGWVIAISVCLALIGFLFARYVSGMAKQKMWANLRGGSGFAVGTALFGLCIAIGHAVDLKGPDVILRYLPMAFSAALVALGAEVLLNFLLDVYRPRKPGEFPRPAFESRVLGFVAAPDRIAESIGEAINYQFGYDVSSSWFYLLLSRVVLRVLAPVAIVTLWAMSALAVIRPHEQGLVVRFGRLSRVIDPGLNFKWPWPIERVEIPEYVQKNPKGEVTFVSHTVTGVRQLDLGSLTPDPKKPALWSIEHPGKETFFLVQPSSATGGAVGSGHDLSALAIEVPLQYSVSNLEAYDRLGPPEMRDQLLRATAQRAVMQLVSTMTVQDLLSARRNELQGALRERVEAAFALLGESANGKPMGAGVRVLFVGVDGLHPPKDTVMAFEQVVGAQQKYYARLKDAEGEAIKTLTTAVGSVELANQIVAELDKLSSMPGTKDGKPDPAVVEQRLKVRSLIQTAGGRAAATLQEASADRWQRHMGEKTRLAAYQGQLGAFRASPAYYRASLYLDALRLAMVDARVYVNDAAERLHVRFLLEDKDSATDIIRENAAANPTNP